MLPDKTQTSSTSNVVNTSGLSGKSITGLDVWRAGSVTIIEVNYTGGPTFVKVRGLEAEVGGDANWGTGTKVRN